MNYFYSAFLIFALFANPGTHGIFDLSEAGGLEFQMKREEGLTAKDAKGSKGKEERETLNTQRSTFK